MTYHHLTSLRVPWFNGFCGARNQQRKRRTRHYEFTGQVGRWLVIPLEGEVAGSNPVTGFGWCSSVGRALNIDCQYLLALKFCGSRKVILI